jgi:hypothetical protein
MLELEKINSIAKMEPRNDDFDSCLHSTIISSNGFYVCSECAMVLDKVIVLEQNFIYETEKETLTPIRLYKVGRIPINTYPFQYSRQDRLLVDFERETKRILSQLSGASYFDEVRNIFLRYCKSVERLSKNLRFFPSVIIRMILEAKGIAVDSQQFAEITECSERMFFQLKAILTPYIPQCYSYRDKIVRSILEGLNRLKMLSIVQDATLANLGQGERKFWKLTLT